MDNIFPKSCDTFVVMGDKTDHGVPIFGKNSDRPQNEVQEVVYHEQHSYPKGSLLECTYITIEQATETHEVVLSKPSWMWGAEMGANKFGVCIGNEAIWSEIEASSEEMLLGMDLLRLGLERGKTALEALQVITSLLETHGQGGPCSDTDMAMTYHNSYLILDPKECWILETVDRMWAAEKITSGYRNISNCLSIETKIDLRSDGLEEKARRLGLYDGKSPFNFRKVFATDSNTERYDIGKDLLSKLSEKGNFKYADMFQVLRTEPIGRCIRMGHPTAASMVSVVSDDSSDTHCIHFLTATPDPMNSIFKPFVFAPNVSICGLVRSTPLPMEQDPAKIKPRFAKRVDRGHDLFMIHVKNLTYDSKMEALTARKKFIEKKLCEELEDILSSHKRRKSEMPQIFNKSVEAEYNLYN